jgi:two-component system chemotaxis response regulator CheY
MEKRTPDKSPTHAIITATRAMIVCEQAYTRRLIADVLYSMGVGKVALFDDPHRAIDGMAQFRPTLLVANWDAPSQDGLELAKFVRQAARVPTTRIPDPTIPIILVGCQQWRRDVNEAERAGVNEYLVKPFSIEDLTRRVANLLLKPKPFINSPNYIGPDRRFRAEEAKLERRRETPFPRQVLTFEPSSLLADFRAGLNARIDNMRQRTWTKSPMPQNVFWQLQLDVNALETEAHVAGDEVIRRIAQSLAVYIAGAGNLFDVAIAETHFSAMHEFHYLPTTERDAARGRLAQLDSLVRTAPMQFPGNALGHRRAS